MRIAALAACVASAMSFIPATDARADGEPSQPVLLAPVSPWTYQFTPYGWLPWLQGNAVVKGRGFAVSSNPAEILEHTRMVWMSYQQAKNGPLTLFTDVMYGDLGSSTSLVTSRSYDHGLNVSIGAALKADYQFWTIEAGGMYEVMQWRSGLTDAAAPDTVLELIAGGRYWRQELDVTLALAGTADLDGLRISRSTAIAESGIVQWVDPFIGARLRHQVNPTEEVWLRGDVGGFSVGSKFTWQVIGAYNWRLCEESGLTLDGYLGYRALAVDYTQGSGVERYVYDVVQQGPVLGVTGRF